MEAEYSMCAASSLIHSDLHYDVICFEKEIFATRTKDMVKYIDYSPEHRYNLCYTCAMII